MKSLLTKHYIGNIVVYLHEIQVCFVHYVITAHKYDEDHGDGGGGGGGQQYTVHCQNPSLIEGLGDP